MIRWVIWRKRETCPDRLLSFNDVMFTYHVLLLRRQKANSYQLESVAFKARYHLRPCSRRREVNSLYFFYSDFRKDCGKAKQNCQKMLAFHCWIFNLVWLGLSNQRKCKQHRSLPASSSSLSSKGFLCHYIPSNFLHRLSWKFWRIDGKRPKIILILSGSWRRIFVWPSENRKSVANDREKNIGMRCMQNRWRFPFYHLSHVT